MNDQKGPGEGKDTKGPEVTVKSTESARKSPPAKAGSAKSRGTATRDKKPNKRLHPPKPDNGFPIVGIGASAGGLKALKQFFVQIPPDSGMAFVVVMHLSPDRESHLAELLQPHIRMPVRQVNASVKLERNQVYVIPPNANLDTIDTHLRLSKLEDQRRERAPIDHFFRTLAATHDGEAIGVILTGTGSDGTLGLKEIKEKGGLTIVQDPNDAEFDGMPQSALSTGLIDFVSPLSEIPDAILRFGRIKPKLDELDETQARSEAGRQLNKLLVHLKNRTGRDFGRYKPSTIRRRIQRRMQLRQIEVLEDYLELLRKEPAETQALAEDLLITVTNFFRDPPVFKALEQSVIPAIFESKQAAEGLRIWSVGCATGEEAYSLAMLLLEEVYRRKSATPIQIFASDLHEHSLKKAREGFYPGDIHTDVSQERLERFFTKEKHGYRVKKELREMVVFAPHNLLGDPPFSRIDLITCRNVLIYLQRGAQSDVMELFHYALRENGHLVLGSSESVESVELFQVVDKKICHFRKRNVITRGPSLPVFPFTSKRHIGNENRLGDESLSHGNLHQRMVELYAPPSALVGPDDKLLHLSEHASRYFLQPGGEFTANVHKLLREELRFELRMTLDAAREKNEAKRSKPIELRSNGKTQQVVLQVRPSLEPNQAGYVLIIFDEFREAAPDAGRKPDGKGKKRKDSESGNRLVEELETELDLTRQRLQTVIEEHETGQEEMKASNEEMQSANEELRSTLEELETSKEELQSMNEELQTVNQENRHKVEELAQLTGDLQNLLAATDIATLFLDRRLNILRFTPKTEEIFNIRPIDRGRPISDLTHRLGYQRLEQDAAEVLKKLVPVEREMQSESGEWFLARVIPYRSTKDSIEGVVITFVDITTRKHAEEEVKQARDRAENIIHSLPMPLLVLTPDLRVHDANQSFYRHFQVAPENLKGMNIFSLGNHQWDIPALRKLLEQVLPKNEEFVGFNVEHEFEGIGRRVMLLNARRLVDMQYILLGFHDVTDIYEAESRLRVSEDRLKAELEVMTRLHELSSSLLDSPNLSAALDKVLDGTLEALDAEMGCVQLWNEKAQALELAVHRGLGKDFLDHFRRASLDDGSACSRAALARQRVVVEDVRKDPAYAPHLEIADKTGFRAVMSHPLLGRNGDLLGVLSLHFASPYRPSDRDMKVLDLNARQAADYLENLRRREASILESRRKDEFLATLAHELRNPLAPIYNGLELLKHAPDQSAMFEDMRRMFERQTGHLMALVDDLLDVSRITRGNLKLKRRTVSLDEVIEGAVEQARPFIEEAGHEIVINKPEKPVYLKADSNRLTQVLTNLINNAAKYSPDSGRIMLDVKEEEKALVIAVSDRGMGIPEDRMEDIFGLFTQYRRPKERSASGLGIGLTLVRSLVEMHGGRVEASSEGVNKGSTFKVLLPFDAANEPAEPDPGGEEAGPAEGSAESAVRRVLIVDDNREAGTTLGKLVELMGHKSVVVSNGRRALEVGDDFQPMLVLLDLGMPDMDGFATARAIRQQDWGRRAVIAALTGWGQEEDKRKTREAGFDAHLVKPVDVRNLEDLLSGLADLPHQTHQTEEENPSSKSKEG